MKLDDLILENFNDAVEDLIVERIVEIFEKINASEPEETEDEVEKTTPKKRKKRKTSKKKVIKEKVPTEKELGDSKSTTVMSWAKEYNVPQKELSIMWKKAESIATKGGTIVYPVAMTIFKNMVKKFYRENKDLFKHIKYDLHTTTKTNKTKTTSAEATKKYVKDLQGK